MQQPFVKGDLVHFLDLDGNVVGEILGTVLGIRSTDGRVLVHWHVGAENHPKNGYTWGRLIHARIAA